MDSHSSRDGGRHGSSRDHHSHRPPRDDMRERDRGERRRRSRSPGHRGSRRDYEVDSYSSSRDFREREREDRHRRGDEWGRGGGRDGGRDGDRGPPRGGNWRDESDRPPRRDRDLFNERRPRRDGRDDRDPRGQPPAPPPASKQRSPSPGPKKKREPTPDLTNVVPVLERKRRLTQWDIKPPGYENVTAEQAKISGMFPLPGQPRQQAPDQSRLQAFMTQSAGSASSTALRTTNARQSKRLFVQNIPSTATDATLQEFFNLHLNGLNVVSGNDPCVSAQISPGYDYALLEFKHPEDATIALALDGISMFDDSDAANGDTNGAASGFSIRRPKDYIVPAAGETEEQSNGLKATVPDSPNKISIVNVPVYLEEEQINELLVAFGELKHFVLVKDSGSDQSKGIVFCEYNDPAVTQQAVQGLDGMELGDKNLKVQRASIGATQAAGVGEAGVGAMTMLAGSTSAELDQGRVLQLLNMVTPEELLDNSEYAEICEDVRDECSKYGEILEMKVPRPAGANRQAAGVGKIFVKYAQPESAQKALQALAGRKFADRTVVVTFFGEEYFDINAW